MLQLCVNDIFSKITLEQRARQFVSLPKGDRLNRFYGNDQNMQRCAIFALYTELGKYITDFNFCPLLKNEQGKSFKCNTQILLKLRLLIETVAR